MYNNNFERHTSDKRHTSVQFEFNFSKHLKRNSQKSCALFKNRSNHVGIV